MTQQQAFATWRHLANMTVARGCTAAEAETAARLREQIAAKYGLGRCRERFAPEPDMTVGRRFRWEYRRCGQRKCWCRKAARGYGHGPYPYAKRRSGSHVRSIYLRSVSGQGGTAPVPPCPE